jgi:hypothetical protein
MHITAIAAGAALLLPALAHSQVNRCQVDGKTVYQATPCDNGRPVNLSGMGKPDPAAAARNARNLRASAAIVDGKVMIGMTADQVRRSWGTPTKINTTITSGRRSEQWVYDWGNGSTQYVYLEDGEVVTIQSPQ